MEEARRPVLRSTIVAARFLLHDGGGGRPGEAAVYTLADPRDASAIMQALVQGAALLNAEARVLGAQLPLL